jgi:hypothetical protein
MSVLATPVYRQCYRQGPTPTFSIMRKTLSTFASVTAVAIFAVTAGAQTMKQTGMGKGGSPHVRTERKLGSAKVAIEYGRPFLKGRDQAQLMPVGQVWRTGADEATVITTNKPLTFGKVVLAPGSYTINTQPGAKDWQVIFGKLSQPKQWGVPYQASLEIGRAPMALGKTKAPVEQVTYSIDQSKTGGALRIEWGTTSASTNFTVGK